MFAHVRRLGLVMWPPRRAGTEMRPGSRPSDGSMVNPDWAGHLILSIPPRGAHGGRAENAIYIFFCVTGSATAFSDFHSTIQLSFGKGRCWDVGTLGTLLYNIRSSVDGARRFRFCISFHVL